MPSDKISTDFTLDSTTESVEPNRVSTVPLVTLKDGDAIHDIAQLKEYVVDNLPGGSRGAYETSSSDMPLSFDLSDMAAPPSRVVGEQRPSPMAFYSKEHSPSIEEELSSPSGSSTVNSRSVSHERTHMSESLLEDIMAQAGQRYTGKHIVSDSSDKASSDFVETPGSWETSINLPELRDILSVSGTSGKIKKDEVPSEIPTSFVVLENEKEAETGDVKAPSEEEIQKVKTSLALADIEATMGKEAADSVQEYVIKNKEESDRNKKAVEDFKALSAERKLQEAINDVISHPVTKTLSDIASAPGRTVGAGVSKLYEMHLSNMPEELAAYKKYMEGEDPFAGDVLSYVIKRSPGYQKNPRAVDAILGPIQLLTNIYSDPLSWVGGIMVNNASRTARLLGPNAESILKEADSLADILSSTTMKGKKMTSAMQAAEDVRIAQKKGRDLISFEIPLTGIKIGSISNELPYDMVTKSSKLWNDSAFAKKIEEKILSPINKVTEAAYDYTYATLKNSIKGAEEFNNFWLFRNTSTRDSNRRTVEAFSDMRSRYGTLSQEEQNLMSDFLENPTKTMTEQPNIPDKIVKLGTELLDMKEKQLAKLKKVKPRGFKEYKSEIKVTKSLDQINAEDNEMVSALVSAMGPEDVTEDKLSFIKRRAAERHWYHVLTPEAEKMINGGSYGEMRLPGSGSLKQTDAGYISRKLDMTITQANKLSESGGLFFDKNGNGIKVKLFETDPYTSMLTRYLQQDKHMIDHIFMERVNAYNAIPAKYKIPKGPVTYAPKSMTEGLAKYEWDGKEYWAHPSIVNKVSALKRPNSDLNSYVAHWANLCKQNQLLFPGYHITTMADGLMKNWLSNTSIPHYVSAIKKMNDSAYLAKTDAYGITLGASTMHDIPNTSDVLGLSRPKFFGLEVNPKANPFSHHFSLYSTNRKVGEFHQNIIRTAMFESEMAKGNGKMAAIKAVRDMHFDPGDAGELIKKMRSSFMFYINEPAQFARTAAIKSLSNPKGIVMPQYLARALTQMIGNDPVEAEKLKHISPRQFQSANLVYFGLNKYGHEAGFNIPSTFDIFQQLVPLDKEQFAQNFSSMADVLSMFMTGVDPQTGALLTPDRIRYMDHKGAADSNSDFMVGAKTSFSAGATFLGMLNPFSAEANRYLAPFLKTEETRATLYNSYVKNTLTRASGVIPRDPAIINLNKNPESSMESRPAKGYEIFLKAMLGRHYVIADVESNLLNTIRNLKASAASERTKFENSAKVLLETRNQSVESKREQIERDSTTARIKILRIANELRYLGQATKDLKIARRVKGGDLNFFSPVAEHYNRLHNAGVDVSEEFAAAIDKLENKQASHGEDTDAMLLDDGGSKMEGPTE